MEEEEVVGLDSLDWRADGVLSELWRQRSGGEYADVAFVCAGGSQVLAHRVVLDCRSALLSEVFTGAACCCCSGGGGGGTPARSRWNCCSMQTLVLPDVDPEALTLLLSLLYTGQVTVPSSCLLGKFKEACSLLRVELPQELLGADEVANAPDQPSQGFPVLRDGDGLLCCPQPQSDLEGHIIANACDFQVVEGGSSSSNNNSNNNGGRSAGVGGDRGAPGFNPPSVDLLVEEAPEETVFSGAGLERLHTLGGKPRQKRPAGPRSRKRRKPMPQWRHKAQVRREQMEASTATAADTGHFHRAGEAIKPEVSLGKAGEESELTTEMVLEPEPAPDVAAHVELEGQEVIPEDSILLFTAPPPPPPPPKRGSFCPSCANFVPHYREREHLAVSHHYLLLRHMVLDGLESRGALPQDARRISAGTTVACPFCDTYAGPLVRVARHVGMKHDKIMEVGSEEERVWIKMAQSGQADGGNG